ncbi:MAG: toxin-antitoxin system HicB family antitoxin [Chloroflexota bacterium]
MTTTNVDEYLQRPYTFEIVKDETEGYAGWFGRVVELPGCMTQADSFAELQTMLEDAMRAWIETALEQGLPIPEPRDTQEYSGKFVVRLPRWLHRELVESAEREGVSLNSLVSVALAKSVGWAAAQGQGEAGLRLGQGVLAMQVREDAAKHYGMKGKKTRRIHRK